MFSTIRLAVAAVLAAPVMIAPTDSDPSASPLLAECADAASSSNVQVDVRHDVIRGHDTDIWTLQLVAGQLARIVVDGDGNSDLDAYLYDENGNLVAKDDDLTDYCVLNVTPRWTGEFSLRIVNCGAIANRYELKLY